MLPGELSAKAVAMGFWHREVEQELQEIGLRDKWAFVRANKSVTTVAVMITLWSLLIHNDVRIYIHMNA